MRRLGIAMIAAACLAAVASCGLFGTRDPVRPTRTQFPCLTLTTPNNLYLNIQQAYGRTDGLSCYLSNLADSTSPTEIGFRFHPDPADSSAAPDQFPSWGKVIEERVAANIANSADPDSFRLTFQPGYDLVASQADLEIRRYTYEMRFDDPSTIPDSLFQGLAEITVKKGAGGEWSVTDWVDRRDPNGTTTRTWGYLRGSYRVGF
jgi:hypothetical protein